MPVLGAADTGSGICRGDTIMICLRSSTYSRVPFAELPENTAVNFGNFLMIE
jgi:hypothetical protein